jgi:hypothetical protein
LTRCRQRCGVHVFVTQGLQTTQLLVDLVRARRRRRTLDRWRTGRPLGGLRLHLNAAWHSAALDHTLAEGVDPHTSAVLALRARKLTGPHARKRVAGGLAGALRSAQDTRPGITAAMRPDARELLDARIALSAVERRLRGSEAVSAQGVAMLGGLLMDAASPLYLPSGPGELASRLRAAAAALALKTSQRDADMTERERASWTSRSKNGTSRRSGGPAAAKSPTRELPRIMSEFAKPRAAGRKGTER